MAPPRSMSTAVFEGRAGSAPASAWLPARIQAPCSRAIASNGAVVGPGIGRAEAR